MCCMHNYISLTVVFLTCIVIAGAKSLKFESHELGHNAHLTPQRIGALLKMQQVLQSNLLILNILLLLLVSITSFDIFQILGLAFIWLIVVHLLAASVRVQHTAKRLAKQHLKALVTLATGIEPALNLLDSTRLIVTIKPKRFTSKSELLESISQSTGVFTDTEQSQIRAILEPAPNGGDDSHTANLRSDLTIET